MLPQSDYSAQHHTLMPRTYVGPPTGIHQDFALRFREACSRANAPTTLKGLGAFFGVSAPTVHDWRHGEKLPSSGTMAEIAKKLKVNYDWLATGRGDEEPPPGANAIVLAHRIERADEATREYIKTILAAAEHRQNLA